MSYLGELLAHARGHAGGGPAGPSIDAAPLRPILPARFESANPTESIAEGPVHRVETVAAPLTRPGVTEAAGQRVTPAHAATQRLPARTRRDVDRRSAARPGPAEAPARLRPEAASGPAGDEPSRLEPIAPASRADAQPVDRAAPRHLAQPPIGSLRTQASPVDISRAPSTDAGDGAPARDGVHPPARRPEPEGLRPATPAPEATPRPVSRRGGEPVVHVSIGRVEVRSPVPPAPRPVPGPWRPRLSLDDYLRERSR